MMRSIFHISNRMPYLPAEIHFLTVCLFTLRYYIHFSNSVYTLHDEIHFSSIVPTLHYMHFSNSADPHSTFFLMGSPDFLALEQEGKREEGSVENLLKT